MAESISVEQVRDWAARLQRLPEQVSTPLPLDPDFLDPFFTILAEMRRAAQAAIEHRPPDMVGAHGHPFASWRVSTDGPNADSRVVLTQVDRHGYRRTGPPVMMIRAEKLPQSDAPGLIEAIDAASAYSFDRGPDTGGGG